MRASPSLWTPIWCAVSPTNHDVLLTIEEGAIGGFGAHVLHFCAWDGLLDQGLKIRPLVLPDRFLDQDTPERMYETAKLDAKSIVAATLSILGREGDVAALTGVR